MIELNAFKKIMNENNNCLPLLTLDEFFGGNTAEDSIAPNDWGYGRPSISEIWDLMRNLENNPDIAWIRIELHNDTEIVESNGKEELVLANQKLNYLASFLFFTFTNNCVMHKQKKTNPSCRAFVVYNVHYNKNDTCNHSYRKKLYRS